MRAVILTLLMFFLAGAARSEIATVTSGEHAGFTRLVVPIGTDRNWEVTGSDRQRHIGFTPDAPDFDLSQVYGRIGRTRIANLTADDGLALSLGCDCDIVIERFRNIYVVIDVADAAVNNQPLPAPGISLPLILPTETGELSASILSAAAHDVDAENPRLSAAADLLALQLSRAAAAGLLEAAPIGPFSLGDPQRTPALAPHPEPPPGTDGEVATLVEPAPVPIRARTAFDLNRPAVLALSESACILGPDTDIGSWAGGASFSTGLGLLRASVHDPRGLIDADATLNLVRFYLYYGFGEEAEFWLRYVPVPPIFESALAAFLTGARDAVFGSFGETASCPDGTLLWVYLGDTSSPPPNAETQQAIARAFSVLPPSLRDLIGPELVRRLHAQGVVDLAEDLHDILTRGDRLSEAERVLLNADLGHLDGSALEETAAQLETVMATDATRAPGAMTRYLRLLHDAGAPIPSEDLVAALALISETGSEPRNDELLAITAVVHFEARDVVTGMALLRLVLSDDRDAGERLLHEVLQSLAEGGHTAPLVVLLAGFSDVQTLQDIPDALRRNLAQFLLDEGLAFWAQDLMASARAPTRPADQRLISAIEGALGLQPPSEPLPPLSSGTGPGGESSLSEAPVAASGNPVSGDPDLSALSAHQLRLQSRFAPTARVSAETILEEISGSVDLRSEIERYLGDPADPPDRL